MTDPEFNELIGHLHRLSGLDGDLGHEYWTRVIRQLREMRALAVHNDRNCAEKPFSENELSSSGVLGST